MEELESFFEVVIACIAIVIGLISSAQKAKNKRIADAAKLSRTQEPPVSQPAPVRPAQPTILPPPAFADVPSQVIMPTVHTHLVPDCDVHDAPGSLGATGAEGKDPCHEPQLTHTRTADEIAPESPALTFDWSGDSIVKAVVMQEILTRPANRTPVWQRHAP